MKKIFSLILIVGSIFLFGCGQSTTDQVHTTQRQTYENSSEWFSLQYPSTRTLQENVYGSTVMFSSPLGEWDTISENISVIKRTLDKTYTPEEYYETNKSSIAGVMTDFAELTNETIQIQDTDVQKVIYKGTQWESKLQLQQVYIIKNNAVYIITYTATQKTFDDFVQTADNMIMSFVGR